MISPMPGLSTILHIFIASVGGTVKSSRKFLKRIKGLKQKKNQAKLLSLVIIFFVCASISMVAYYIVVAEFKSDNSNLNIIERLSDGDSATAGISNTQRSK